jgi:SAM-dependent methyltransferase
VCGALERHRMVSLFLQARTDLIRDADRVLHVAPEPPIERLLKEEGLEYVSLDLGERDAMMQADLTRMPFPERAFDGIYCGHVLEHIPEDVRAISEMCRVLRPRGWAIIQVPINRRRTFEDPSIEDPALRRRFFGQRDHVRVYGHDFRDRLEQAGFAVTVERPYRRMARDEVEHFGLSRRDDIFLCRRAD